MKGLIARATMRLATACLSERDGVWREAMRAEFQQAGPSLRFASGCLIAALRRLPTQAEGRFTLSAYVFALALMIPMASLQIWWAVMGFPYLAANSGDALGDALLADVHRAAVPSLALLLVLLGGAQIRMAWLLLERDWVRVRKTGLLTLAAATTLLIFMGSLFLDPTRVAQPSAILLIELAVLAGFCRWHADLPGRPAA